MTVENWRRDEPTFYSSLALERRTVDAPPPIDGCRGALMSKDTSSDAQTCIIVLPKNWEIINSVITISTYLLEYTVLKHGHYI